MFEDLSWQEEGFTAESDDPVEASAREFFRTFFERNSQSVYFSRQLEVQNEDRFFHWITNRAVRDLVAEGTILTESRKLSSGGTVKLLWHRGYRYYKREAARVVELVNEYSDPNIGGALGLQGEALILEGFARLEFVMKGREARSYGGRVWTETDHDLDFVFERDGRAYGIEVKNTLGYMDPIEFSTKIRLCLHLGIRPVIAARMLPKSWINDLINAGGFALIFKYQLYPWAHRQLARTVQSELGLPVDSPRSLSTGTMGRFLRWHQSL
ncbi:MAG: hypothetical protein JWM21_2301 [Acidobacteria bacterium]|nr:hypothetical protein [Acidobacteriota bacterium]